MILDLTRRTFIKLEFAGVVAILLKVSTDFVTSQTSNTTSSIDTFEITPNYFGKSVRLGEKGLVWLIREKEGFYALDRRCTHLGCPVNWDKLQEMFVCPCHNSKFHINGDVWSGPASKSLIAVRLRKANHSSLIADTSLVVPKNWRFSI